jgi:glutathione S-transferase
LRDVYVQRLGGREAMRKYIASKPSASQREFLTPVTELGIEAPLARESLEEWNKAVADMETALAAGPWLAGETYSLADIAYASYITRLECLQLDFMWEKRRRVTGWYDRLKNRPAYQSAIVKWLVKDEIERMRENGRRLKSDLKRMLSARSLSE